MVIDNEIATGLFVGMDPATGIVAGVGDDDSSQPVLGWDPVQGDTYHWAPAGSVGGGGTRLHRFDRPITVTGAGTFSGALTIGGNLAFSGADPRVSFAANYYIRLTSATGVIDFVSNTVTALSIPNNGGGIILPGKLASGAAALDAQAQLYALGTYGLRLQRNGGTAPTTGNLLVLHSNIGYSGGTGADTLYQSDWGQGFYVNLQSGTPLLSLVLTNAGHLRPGSDNALDIGLASFRWRNLLLGGNITSDATSGSNVFAAQTDVNALFRVTKTAIQAALRYDTSNRVEMFVDSTGVYTQTAFGSNPRFAFAGAAGSGSVYLRLMNGTGGVAHVNWQIAKSDTVAQSLEFTPSTANDGVTFTTPAMRVTSTGQFYASMMRPNGSITGTGIAVESTSGVVGSIGFVGPVATWIGSGTNSHLAVASYSGRDIIFFVNGSSSAHSTMTTSTYNASADNALDLGSASLRWRHIYLSGNIIGGADGYIRGGGSPTGQKFALLNTSINRNYLFTGTAGLYINNAADNSTLYMFSDAGVFTAASQIISSSYIAQASGGAVITWDQSGTRSWTATAGSGNWILASGDGSGLIGFSVPFGAIGLNWGAKDGIRATIQSTSGHTCFQAWDQATSSDNRFLTCYTEGGSGTLRGSIDFNRGSGVTRYNTTSDGTLKEILGDADPMESLAILRGTRLRSFVWKDDETQKPQIGPIAQELYAVFKGAVSVGGIRQREVDGKMVDVYQPWAVDKTAFAWHLLAGWQDHDDRISKIERALEARAN